jgi:succinate dehydrogenase/fumarate reductase flavoprotein subunit
MEVKLSRRITQPGDLLTFYNSGGERMKGALKSLEKQHIKTEILVVGGGVAGCYAAIYAAEKGLEVTLISKSLVGKSGCSRHATNLVGGPPHMYMSAEERKKLASISIHTDDENSKKGLTTAQKEQLQRTCAYYGHYLVDQDYILETTKYAQETFLDYLENRGLYLRRMSDGRILSNTGPVHSRNTWAPRQGQTGPQLMDLLRHEVFASGVKVIEECMATSLLTDNGEVSGAIALDIRKGKLFVISAKATLLCTGHSLNTATRTTATREMYGDGWWMAYRVGAELVNFELHYIHCVDTKDPITMNQHCYPNPNPNTDKSPHIVDSEGEFFFTPDMFKQGQTVMYHLQLKRIIKKIYEGKARPDGGYYSSYRHMVNEVDPEYLRAKRVFDKLGYNIAVEPIENALCWEMNEGGIKCDMKTMQSNLPGLYAPGSTGGHGFGSFPRCMYDATLAVNHARKRCQDIKIPTTDINQVSSEEVRLLGYLRVEPRGGFRPATIQTRIRRIISDTLIPIKNEEKMQKGLEELNKIRKEMVPRMSLESTSLNYNVGWINAIDLEVMIDICALQILASLERKESRGPFFREDYPYVDNENWCVSNIVKLVDGIPKFRQEPVYLKYVRPDEEGKVDYFKVAY